MQSGKAAEPSKRRRIVRKWNESDWSNGTKYAKLRAPCPLVSLPGVLGSLLCVLLDLPCRVRLGQTCCATRQWLLRPASWLVMNLRTSNSLRKLVDAWGWSRFHLAVP